MKTLPQPVPAQVRHGLVALRRPEPPHCRHWPAGWATKTLPLPPQTRHEMTWPTETAHLPVPAHHAHVSGAKLLCGWPIARYFRFLHKQGTAWLRSDVDHVFLVMING